MHIYANFSNVFLVFYFFIEPFRINFNSHEELQNFLCKENCFNICLWSYFQICFLKYTLSWIEKNRKYLIFRRIQIWENCLVWDYKMKSSSVKYSKSQFCFFLIFMQNLLTFKDRAHNSNIETRTAYGIYHWFLKPK